MLTTVYMQVKAEEYLDMLGCLISVDILGQKFVRE